MASLGYKLLSLLDLLDEFIIDSFKLIQKGHKTVDFPVDGYSHLFEGDVEAGNVDICSTISAVDLIAAERVPAGAGDASFGDEVACLAVEFGDEDISALYDGIQGVVLG